jgi:hypothetical protein
MSNETLISGKKAENAIKESLFLFTLYICVTIAILTLMTLIYDVLSTGTTRKTSALRSWPPLQKIQKKG